MHCRLKCVLIAIVWWTIRMCAIWARRGCHLSQEEQALIQVTWLKLHNWSSNTIYQVTQFHRLANVLKSDHRGRYQWPFKSSFEDRFPLDYIVVSINQMIWQRNDAGNSFWSHIFAFSNFQSTPWLYDI